jgi:multidrug resistance protein
MVQRQHRMPTIQHFLRHSYDDTQKTIVQDRRRPAGRAVAAQAIRHPMFLRFDQQARDTQAMSIDVVLSKAPATRSGQRTAMACRAVICAFAATGILATNIFLPSLPAIAADLRVSSAAVTSTISVFLAIVAVGQLIVGPLSDRVGRQMPILIGLCIFVLGTIWCTFAGDLLGLLIGRSIQACGACTMAVLSRAIARDLFDGQDLAKVMASITIATAAAPGFSPLVGSALDHFFGWRSEFAFVAIVAICAGAAYVMFIGETKAAGDSSLHPLKIAGSYLRLIRDARFAAPARTASLLMAGVFAVFSGAARASRRLWIVANHARSAVCRNCLPGIWRRHAGAKVIGAVRALTCDAVWPGTGRCRSCRATCCGAGREALAGSVSCHRFDLPVRGWNCEPAVECGRAIAIRQQGRPRGGPVRLLANGGGRMRRVARSDPLQRSGYRAWNRAGADIPCRADPAWVERAASISAPSIWLPPRAAVAWRHSLLKTKCTTSCDRTTRRKRRHAIGVANASPNHSSTILDPIAMDDGHGVAPTEHIIIAALIMGFALALGVALNELDAAVTDVVSSLATIATIGN